MIYRSFESINKDNPVSISNNELSKKRVVFFRGFKPKHGSVSFSLTNSEGKSKLLLLDNNFRYIQAIQSNARTTINNLGRKSYHIAVTVPPGCNVDITELSVDTTTTAENSTKDLLDTLKSDTLLIAPGYPSIENLYNHAFIHTRAKLYRDYGLKKIDIVVVNDSNINQNATYEIDGITIHNIGYNDVRLLLQQKKYKRIFIHFFSQKHAQILDASDTSSTQIFIYTHGGDVLYRDHSLIFREYFKNRPPITKSLDDDFSMRDSALLRYNTYTNVHWIFATEWCKNRAEHLLGTKFNRAHVISNPISSSVFSYRKRNPDDRKKICIVRPFNKLSSYSIDVSVRTILELSTRPFFSDLEFNIYGTGETHELLTRPLVDFSNVKVHNTFLDSKSLARAFQDHGIVLMPSRYDSQGVSACEAAMTGAAVISSDGDIGLKDCIDPAIGMYCETENFKDYADRIEGLYSNTDVFLDVSKKMYESAFNKCSEDFSIKKEVALIKSTEQFHQELHFKPKVSKPILTIVVPSYNVERYLKNGVLSLINHRLAHKLEVLIVNDGSKDNTKKIGLELESLSMTKNGPIVKIIDKENGGHGSTINKGIELATGKYFRLMDGDDYFVTDELVRLIEKLENESSDIVLTNYIEDFSIDAVKNPVRHYSFMTPGLQYDLDVMQYHGYGFGDWGPLLSTTTCRTDILKDANFKIDENAFYVDMEYNFIIYAMSKTVVYYPLDIYSYYLGRAGQSMSKESFTKNYLHHEKVTLRLIDEFYSHKDSLSDGKRQYLVNKIILPMCKTQYMINTEYHMTRAPFMSFDSKLSKFRDFYDSRDVAGRLIRLHRLTGGYLIGVHDPIRNIINFTKRIIRV